MKLLRIVVASALFVAGCSSSTMIDTVPSGAKLYMDGVYKGTTPYRHHDTKIVGSTTQLRLEKEGYDQMFVLLKRNEQADVGAIIGGIFFLFPFLWVMEYDPSHVYEMRPVGTAKRTEQSIELSGTKMEKLRELKKMVDEGLITQDDYEKQKQKVLDSE